MTCLLQAIGPKSLLEDKEKRWAPDENGGFEMGTWTYVQYLGWFRKIAGNDYITEVGYPEFSNTIGLFTPEAHDKIINRLKEILKTLPKGKISKRLISNRDLKQIREWCGVGELPVYPKRNPLVFTHRKWYERLLKIFESGEAVIYTE